jgi:DNA polymerase-1
MREDTSDPGEAVRAAVVTVLSLLDPTNNKIGERIDRTLFCWDGKSKTDKKDRSPKPPEYVETIKILQETLTLLLDTEHVELPDHEADDMVATAAFHSKADTVFIVSGDKDLSQLQSKNVYCYCLHSKGVLTNRLINTKWGIKHPNQLAIALAILGDKVDNIKGIKGWGPKKVKTLFEKVTPEMNFEQALQAIEDQIPESLLEDFYKDLSVTLLDPFLKGVPSPKPINLAPLSVVQELRIPKMMQFYQAAMRAYHVHENLGVDEVDEEQVET